MAEMVSEEFTCIFLLVGKTGAGKSATGNKILGNSLFKSNDSCISVTSDISCSSAVRQGYTLTVIDTPGVMDTRVKSTEANWKSCQEMIHAMSKCPTTGKLAIVIVLKYGERFTKENKATIQVLTRIFGEENIWKSCIIIFTHGNSYLKNNKDKPFHVWVKEQKGELGKIIGRCGFKCVLFDNKSQCPVRNEEQLKELIGFVEQLDQSYTKTKFEEAKKQHNRLELEAMLPKLISEFQNDIDLLTTNMHSIAITSASLDEISRLGERAGQILDRIKAFDDPSKIYYDDNEKSLLYSIESQAGYVQIQISLMLNSAQMKKVVNCLKMSFYNLIQEINGATHNDLIKSCDVNKIEEESKLLYLEVKDDKFSKSDFDELNQLKLATEEKLAKLKTDVECAEKASRLTQEIDALQLDVTNLNFPTTVGTFSTLSERADNIISDINDGGLKRQKKIYLLLKITLLKSEIHNLKVDNDMFIGWTSTTAITGMMSIGTIFIPIVGIPISIALNVTPIIGRAIHTKVERWRRENMEKQLSKDFKK